ncbi:D-alanyl-D-alanine endopeptidase [Solimonas sp. K1W22B-7]|uniref:D-alanyl-D-alanine endopeptidase n=1 Tax=Solimonas sp. K1W22B-7 TaxID=2303331 RepID=UPI000E337E42|nr:D-alanyl-D-alanine endopeptidase [Solimonas sp. K1W22B-7]AXQ31021.1 D-alanyl-D-alanine endopeptidase [Solimonas sp. K1W22B-7]
MKKNRTGGLVAGWRQLLLALALAGLSAGVNPALAATPVKEKAAKSSSAAKKEGAASTKTTTKRKSAVGKKATGKAKSKASAKKRVSRKTTRRSVRRVVAVAPAIPSLGQALGLHHTRDELNLGSSVAMVVDQRTHEVLFSKNPDAVLPIASITKLMTALVVMDARLPMDEILTITSQDIDLEKGSHSRLRVGLELSREDLMLLALMSSENRAASALGRNYPGGISAFVSAMNRKARELGMRDSRFVDSSGLSSSNVSSASDLVRMVNAAYGNPTIRRFSTQAEHTVEMGRSSMQFVSSNRLVRYRGDDWQIGLQKTGYISEAGRCLVMQARIQDRPVVMVFLDSSGKLTRFADAQRVRNWLETRPREQIASPGVGGLVQTANPPKSTM